MNPFRLPAQFAATATLCLSVLAVAPAQADGPGTGITAEFEVDFLRMTIDHHYSALRITELAAGTDAQRNGQLSAAEGTSPTPGFAATPAKATLDDLKSLARRNNRMQREEILNLQTKLRDWYGMDYQPRLRADGQQMIGLLEQARAGAEFNHLFLEVFSRHHFMMLEPASACVTGSDLKHEELRRECRSMWMSQTADIEMMREELKKHFGIVDYQPFRKHEVMSDRPMAPRGRHSGHD
jgi:uncharacterized protein (DUF305 family)